MKSTIAYAALLLVALTGCDKSGVHGLFSQIDVVETCPGSTSTWLRTTGTATEIFIIGNDDPTEPMSAGTPSCMHVYTIGNETSGIMHSGSYYLEADGTGTFTEVARYDFEFMPDSSLLARDGASRTDLDPEEVHTIAFVMDGNELLATLDGAERRLTNIFDLVTFLDPTTQEGAEEIFRLYNYSLYCSQIRIPAFGGTGMTQYIASLATFNSFIANTYTLVVDSLLSPTVRMSFLEHEDLTGQRLDGTQISSVDLGGNGSMRGTVAWSMRDGPDPADVALSGLVDYEGLQLRDGVAAGSTYRFVIDGFGEYLIDFDQAYDMDMGAVLPPSSP